MPGAGTRTAVQYEDVAGFCKAATLDEIRQHSHILTPGRYVGAAEVEDDGEPFEEKMQRLTAQLRSQQAEARKLDSSHRRQPGGTWVMAGGIVTPENSAQPDPGVAAMVTEVKGRIQAAQTRAVLAVNAELVRLYWDIGRIIDERQRREGWGADMITRLDVVRAQ